MSALSEMIRTQESTPLGAVIIAVAANGDPAYAELAAAELAALRAELATATRTAEVWERQHKEIVAELALAQQRIAELEQAAP